LNCFSKCNDVKQQQPEATELQAMYQQQPKSSSHEAKDAARKKSKPFCKVCFDAGKPEKEYTSHYVKTEEGNVNCPTLLNQSCLNCGRPGHTSGYCDQAKTNPRCNQSNQSNQQRTQPTIVLSNPRPMIGAEAELKLMTTMFKSKSQSQYKNDDFPSLKAEPKEEPENIHNHVYNPKSNPFGALTQKQNPTQPTQPNQHNQHNQKSFQPPQPQPPQPQQSPAKPMTMAERLKNPAPIKPEPKPKPVERPKFADMPPKSQFWWQDED
jgi:hypothetical protein